MFIQTEAWQWGEDLVKKKKLACQYKLYKCIVVKPKASKFKFLERNSRREWTNRTNSWARHASFIKWLEVLHQRPRGQWLTSLLWKTQRASMFILNEQREKTHAQHQNMAQINWSNQRVNVIWRMQIRRVISFLSCGQLLHLWPPRMTLLSGSFKHQNGCFLCGSHRNQNLVNCFELMKRYLFGKRRPLKKSFTLE